MAKTPFVSVLMAVHNSEKYLAQAIESILQQTFEDFELIAINDGSTDRSGLILQSYAVQDRRIRWYSQENQGIPKTRNRLLAESRADLIAVMDSDDVSKPHRLARQVDYLQQHPTVVCLGSAFELIDARGRLITHLPVPLDNATIQQKALAGHASIFQPCAMMRRTTVQQIGGYDETMTQAEDLDLWLRLGELGELANLPDGLVQYRLHSDSVSEKDCALQRQKAYEACQRAWQRRGLIGQFEASDPWRPGKDRASRHKFAMQYGWWAFNSRQRQTALVYGLKAIQLRPVDLAGWKLLGSALVKPLPVQALH